MKNNLTNFVITKFAGFKNQQPLKKEDGSEFSILDFIDEIRSGEYKDITGLIRKAQNDSEVKKRKEKLPFYIIAGLYRNFKDKITDSHLICLDFDKVKDIDLAFSRLTSNPYTMFCAKSVSGKGLFSIVKIKQPDRFKDHFRALVQYYNSLGLKADKSCSNHNRARFVTYDPDCYDNINSKVWTRVKSESKKAYKERDITIVHTDTDVEDCIQQLEERQIDITTEPGVPYDLWPIIGFAFADKYGEDGRNYFHRVSAIYSGYNHDKCDIQYDRCLREAPDTGRITIRTFLHLCRKNGVNVSYSTIEAASIVKAKKKRDNTKEQVRDYLIRQKEMSLKDAEQIIDQAWHSPLVDADLSPLVKMRLLIEHNYHIEYEQMSESVTINGVNINSDDKLARIISDIRIEIGQKVSISEVRNELNAFKFQNKYHAIKRAFENKNNNNYGTGHIKELARCIPCKNHVIGMSSQEYKYIFIRKWLIGMIAKLYGHRTSLVFVYRGEPGIGKSYFFDNLLPEWLQPYVTQDSLDSKNSRDVKLLISQNILIVDREGKSTNISNQEHFKSLIDETTTYARTLRTDKGKTEYKSIATLAIDTNKKVLFKDDNRRLFIIDSGAIKRDFHLFDSIDKEALIMEAYHAYKNGETWELTYEENQAVLQSFSEYRSDDIVKDCILKVFTPSNPSDQDARQIPTTNIQELVKYFTPSMTQKQVSDIQYRLPEIFEKTRIGKKQIRGYWCSGDEHIIQAAQLTTDQLQDRIQLGKI